MKTPREILLKQHRAADTRLDALRENVLATAVRDKDVSVSANPPRNIWLKLWTELFWPCRHAWTGLAALWLVLWVMNSALFRPQTTAPKLVRSQTAILVQRLQEQRRLLVELMPPSDNPPAEPPRRNHQPRSQRRSWTFSI
jgi:hypothetical protein